jgi:hypothetical protein
MLRMRGVCMLRMRGVCMLWIRGVCMLRIRGVCMLGSMVVYMSPAEMCAQEIQASHACY